MSPGSGLLALNYNLFPTQKNEFCKGPSSDYSCTLLVHSNL